MNQEIPSQTGQVSAPISASLGRYGKLYAAVIGLALTILTQKYGAAHAWWLPWAVMLASGGGVYATPNTPLPQQVVSVLQDLAPVIESTHAPVTLTAISSSTNPGSSAAILPRPPE